MKPAAFDYYKPETLAEALSLLDEFGYDAKILAGGQSLIPMMNMRLARPPVLIDINGVPGMTGIEVGDSEIVIGGLTRHYMVEHSAEIERSCPMLAEGIKLIGHSQIRSRGTIGGSIVHADPTAELPVMLTALGGKVTVVSSGEERELTPEELFLTYMTTTIEPNEIVKSVHFPVIAERTGHAIEEFTLRSGDFAIIIAAASVTLDEEGLIESAALCIGGVDGVPVKLDEVTDELIGQAPSEELFAESCEPIVDMVEPEKDIHASVEYRKDLCVALSRRVLKKAADEAKLA
ncbi:carbon-monoxide dehydrogenase medium subunit/2-furoyl-CoA dehydrogenase FAD binding subunit [Paenibacillus forsythiae]|uniref:Carbon-monoxide dehydrogenase medium subunit/2-furoyl-CoA dehydrogenase FAD binding subunit n=1 Tax=Paenibacillus forsythiae TaxID=365616 RepID=A0ABU3HC60_9BACL|nr:xanthine dehydrogenase family protein subunit M [Paenibacillus forsythiae]MDT3428410.1 carbon-monoxide dehydrogenase medium subunit/2-furoyl-CoA dehydrogenase FAD binding subunit [Paenibacillus forsythiae]